MFFIKKNNFSGTSLDSVIQACLKKDGLAQKELIRLYIGYVKGVSFKYGANKEEAEEIINDVFLKVFNKLDKYDKDQPFKAWLRTIIINTAIDYYRKNEKYTHQVDLDEVDVIDFNDDIIGKISAEEILTLVQKLPPSYRMVFSLYVIDGYNHREIAEMLGIKEGTSKSNLQDARRKLQTMLIDAYPNLYYAYDLKNYRLNEN